MELLMEASSHGPGMHGVAVAVIAVVLVTGVLSALLIRAVKSRRHPGGQSDTDEVVKRDLR